MFNDVPYELAANILRVVFNDGNYHITHSERSMNEQKIFGKRKTKMNVYKPG